MEELWQKYKTKTFWSVKNIIFPGGSVVKNPPANEESTGDTGSIPGAGRFPEEEMATHSGVPACRTP